MPLNPALYERLLQEDPTCTVVSEGVPAEYYIPNRKLGYTKKGHAYGGVSSWGECYRINCPRCGDTKGHLYFCYLAGARVKVKSSKQIIKFSDSLCVCHRRHCNREDPKFKDWLNSLKLYELPILDLSENGIKTSTAPLGVCIETEDELPNPTYPLLSDYTPGYVRDWLFYERHYDPALLQNDYGVGYCPEGAEFIKKDTINGPCVARFLQERIVVPVIQGRSLVGWQARKIGSNCGTVKYLTSPNLSKSKVLYNLDTALLYNVVILVEGVFDVWRLGPQAVALFGTSISEIQKMQLKAIFGCNGGCLIFLDSDANQKAYSLAVDLVTAGIFPRGVVPIYTTDGKDPDDRSYEENRILVEDAIAKLAPLSNVKPEDADIQELLREFNDFNEITGLDQPTEEL